MDVVIWLVITLSILRGGGGDGLPGVIAAIKVCIVLVNSLIHGYMTLIWVSISDDSTGLSGVRFPYGGT